MLFNTPTQFVVLALLVVIGFVFGMLAAPRGTKWKQRYRTERDEHAAYRHATDAKLRDQEATIAAREHRIADLEKQTSELTIQRELLERERVEWQRRNVAAEPPVADSRPAGAAPLAGTAPPIIPPPVIPPPVTAPTAQAAARAAFTAPDQAQPGAAPAKRSWFGLGARNDDLTRITGIDADIRDRLSALSVSRFADLADLSGQDELALEQHLDLPAGYIQREQWQEQARLLANGRDADWQERFGAR